MSYTPPPSTSVSFGFTQGGYAPPAASAVNVSFGAAASGGVAITQADAKASAGAVTVTVTASPAPAAASIAAHNVTATAGNAVALTSARASAVAGVPGILGAAAPTGTRASATAGVPLATAGAVVSLVGARASALAGSVTASAAQVPFLDGHALVADGATSYFYSGHTGAATPVTLTTTHANDVICVLAMTMDQNAGAAPSVSSITASGLTFARRKAINGSSSSGGATSLELWYAVASAPFSGPVTVNWSSVPTAMNVIAFGVANANTSAPFDANASLPAVSNVNPPTVSGISTTSADAFVITAWASSDEVLSEGGTPPAGFTALASELGALWGDYTYNSSLVAAYEVTSAPLSNATVAWPYGSTDGLDMQVLVDAITGVSGGTSGGTGATLTGAASSATAGAVTPRITSSAMVTLAGVSATTRAGTIAATPGAIVGLTGARVSAAVTVLGMDRTVVWPRCSLHASAASQTLLTTVSPAGVTAAMRGATVAGIAVAVSPARGVGATLAGAPQASTAVGLAGAPASVAPVDLSAALGITPPSAAAATLARPPAGVGPRLGGARVSTVAWFIGPEVPVALPGARMTAIAHGTWVAWQPGLFIEPVSRRVEFDAVSRPADYFAPSRGYEATATMPTRDSYALITQDNE